MRFKDGMKRSAQILGFLTASTVAVGISSMNVEEPKSYAYTGYLGHYLGSDWCTWEFHKDFPFWLNFIKPDETVTMRTFPCPHAPGIRERIGWWKV